jgi:hypothetical protein
MINIDEAKVLAWKAISDLFGNDYFRSHFEGSCESYPSDDVDGNIFKYFLGFDGDTSTDMWTVFAWVSVNRDTMETSFLDYKTPDGKRMENPPQPIRRA